MHVAMTLWVIVAFRFFRFAVFQVCGFQVCGFSAFQLYDINTIEVMVPYLFLLLVYSTPDETCFFQKPQFDADFSHDFSVVPCPPCPSLGKVSGWYILAKSQERAKG